MVLNNLYQTSRLKNGVVERFGSGKSLYGTNQAENPRGILQQQTAHGKRIQKVTRSSRRERADSCGFLAVNYRDPNQKKNIILRQVKSVEDKNCQPSPGFGVRACGQALWGCGFPWLKAALGSSWGPLGPSSFFPSCVLEL